jgi:hypothetical protein
MERAFENRLRKCISPRRFHLKSFECGPLGGRFGFRFVKPLSIPDGVTLLYNLIRIYRSDLSIQPEMAFYASSQVGGHP